LDFLFSVSFYEGDYTRDFLLSDLFYDSDYG
jgi:hypothetical protein